jgi:hypothetical protein
MQKKPQQTADKLKQRSGRSHEEMVFEILKANPEFADAYLAAALEET